MKRSINIDKTLLMLLAGGLLIRLAVAVPVFADMSRTASCYDAVSYNLLAHHILDGKGFSASFHPPYKPNSTITPGYPAFLTAIYALTGRCKQAVIFVQIILNLIVLAMLYRFLKKRFGGKSCLWMGVLFIADLNMIMFCAILTTETLFTLLLVSLLITLIRCFQKERFGLAVVSGMLLGVSTLVRPIVIYFAAPLLIYVFLSRFKWRKLAQWAVILGIQLAFITPWVIRNKVVFGEYFYTTISDVNLLRFHAAPLKAGLQGIPRDEAQLQLELEGTQGRTDFNEAGYYRRYGKAARRYLLKHPLPYIGSLFMGGLATLLYPLPMSDMGFYFRGPDNLPTPGVAQSVMVEVMRGRVFPALKIAWDERLHYFGLAVFIIFLVYSVYHLLKLGAGLRAYIVRGFGDPAMLLFLITGLYFLGLLGFGISPRMRVPLEPLLVSLAGMGIVSRRMRKQKSGRKVSKDVGE